MMQLSPSQINEVRICMARYYYRRIARYPRRKQIPTVYGSAIDKTIETMLINKRSGSIESLDHYLNLATTSYQQLAAEAETTADERDFYLNNALAVLCHYYRNELPVIEPMACQVQNKFDAEEFSVHQIFDLVTIDDVVIDYKAPLKRLLKKKGKWEPKTFDHIIQLYCYHHGFFATHGYYPSGLELHYLMPPKQMKRKFHPPEIVKVKIDYEAVETDAELAIRRAWDLIQAVYRGQYAPNRSKMNFLCSHKWCDFAKQCEEEFGGKVRK